MFPAGFDFWRPDFPQQLIAFLSLTVRSMGLALLLSIPAGILHTRFQRLATPLISGLGLLQTIPSLAFIGFCISLLAIAEGSTIAILCAVVYSVFPIVLNTYTGIIQVDPRIKDAALGTGMTDWQILWKIELPLAWPVIMAGVRTGVVYTIGMVTICAIAGASGLGTYVTTGMSRGDVFLTLFGIVTILLFTMVMLAGLSWLSHVAKDKASLALTMFTGIILVLAGFAFLEPVVRALALEPSATGAAIEMELPQHSFSETWQATNDFWRQTGLFLSLTARGLGLALVIGLPFGIVLTRYPRVASPIISALALVQTVPSLALLGLAAALFGLFGASATVTATIIYSLLPIVLNTYTGITQVDPRVKDAARGMGMTDRQLLLKVELPIAMPVIMAGVRTAAAYAIIMVTTGVLVGARGLGGYIMDGITQKANPLILIGVIPIVILTFAVFLILSGITWLSRVRATMGQTVGSVLIACLSLFALAEPFLRPRSDIRIGCKNFTENLILGHILKLVIESHTDLTVDLIPNLGSNFAYKSLLNGNIDVYPEYTGTLLTAPDALNLKVPVDEGVVITDVVKKKITELNIKVPPGEDAITALVRYEMEQSFGLELLGVFGLNNGYAVAVVQETKEKYGLKTVGDLNHNPKFKVVVAQEFLERPDGWSGLKRIYNLKLGLPEQVNPSLMYAKLEEGQADVVIGFTTDWQIDVYNLAVLKDDKGFFPSYHAAPLVRDSTLAKYPQIGKALRILKNKIDDAAIRRLNREVIVNKRKPDEVAREFLQKKGLLKNNKQISRSE